MRTKTLLRYIQKSISQQTPRVRAPVGINRNIPLKLLFYTSDSFAHAQFPLESCLFAGLLTQMNIAFRNPAFGFFFWRSL